VLLSLDAEDTRYYFYNVTNIIDLIDYDKSKLAPKGSILKVLFDTSKTLSRSQIFKVKGLENSKFT
jgi:hypothetical protein